MRAVVCLLAVLFLFAASSAVAQEKHLIDPMLPGLLDPELLSPLKNPDALGQFAMLMTKPPHSPAPRFAASIFS